MSASVKSQVFVGAGHDLHHLRLHFGVLIGKPWSRQRFPPNVPGTCNRGESRHNVARETSTVHSPPPQRLAKARPLSHTTRPLAFKRRLSTLNSRQALISEQDARSVNQILLIAKPLNQFVGKWRDFALQILGQLAIDLSPRISGQFVTAAQCILNRNTAATIRMGTVKI